jgi:hypothetical protein
VYIVIILHTVSPSTLLIHFCKRVEAANDETTPFSKTLLGLRN